MTKAGNRTAGGRRWRVDYGAVAAGPAAWAGAAERHVERRGTQGGDGAGGGDAADGGGDCRVLWQGRVSGRRRARRRG
eukprot:5062634-Prymnesium_polylepis.1